MFLALCYILFIWHQHRVKSYYFHVTVACFHGRWLQVRLGNPDVSNATISIPGMDDVVKDDDGNIIFYLTKLDDSVDIAIGGTLPDDTDFIGKIYLYVAQNVTNYMYIGLTRYYSWCDNIKL